MGVSFSKVVLNLFGENSYGSWRKPRLIFVMSIIDLIKVKSEGLSFEDRRLLKIVVLLMNMVSPEEPFSPVLTCPW